MCSSDLKVIELTENKGVSNARNVGITNATGEYITFVDSDDFVSEKYISTLATLQSRYPTMLVMCMPEEYDDKNAIKYKNDGDNVNIYDKEEYLATQYFYHPWACACAFNKDTILKNDLFFCVEAKFGEDAYFVNKYLCFCDGLAISQKRMYYYYIHSDGGSISKKGKNYTSKDVESRYSSYKAYKEAIELYEMKAPEYVNDIKSSYCFLAADIILMQLRANDHNTEITDNLQHVLSIKNCFNYILHCRYMKHTLLVLGMKFMPNITYRVLERINDEGRSN